MDAEHASCSLADAPHLDCIVRAIRIVELGELRVLESTVEADGEMPVGRLHRDDIEGEFKTFVLHRSDVG